ncbi:MAG: peptide-modifying radical SAM enzyme CbpB [Thermoguttaceae bacterium]
MARRSTKGDSPLFAPRRFASPGRKSGQSPSRGRYVGTGNGPAFQPLEIGHGEYVAVVEPDTAFWALVRREKLAELALGGPLRAAFAKKAARFAAEMHTLRFGLTPSAVYFNPTERCNLDCTYCYIPRPMRRGGRHMSEDELLRALETLKRYFQAGGVESPQVIFHGAEPLLNREAVFAGIERYGDYFRFGIQTNATLLDDAAVEFLRRREVSIGISLDAPTAAVADRTRKTWKGEGVHRQVLEAMARLAGYPAWSVICTVTRENLRQLGNLVEFLHRHEAPTCLMNILRCTLPPARAVRPDDAAAARYFLAALDRAEALYRASGRRLVVGNFANILLAILAPSARRLMCDISPCGGGRCFFAVAPGGDLFPCSEFIGLSDFCGGNLFRDAIPAVLQSAPFRMVTGRKVEDIEPCRHCAIRHFCGAPCPAEAHQLHGGMDRTGAFCEFYEEQVRYAFRVIADGRLDAFLWDDWDRGMTETFAIK